MTDHLLVLSTSSVTEYLRCHHRYFLGHVYRMRGTQSVPAAIGQAVHAGVEAMHKGQPPENALQRAWDEESANVPPEELAADHEALADARKRHALSYRAAGAAIGIDAPTMVRIEKGVLLPTEAQWKALRQFIGSAP